MIPTRRPPSRTLPRNFTFHYNDEDAPQTPEPQDMALASQKTSATPREPYRFRRRRDARQLHQNQFQAPASHDIPIPTIEISDQSTPVDTSPTLNLAHLTRFGGSPPKTPCAQIQAPLGRDTTMDETEHAETFSQGESISRPSTACSGFSDSSVSSSIDSFPSVGDSFTSPETESTEFRSKVPFATSRPFTNLSSPPRPYSKPKLQRPIKVHRIHWTEELDHHIWTAYLRYLQDPTRTPFKMLPGTAPPLGVCSRVVRDAKRTWKGMRAGCSSSNYRLLPYARPNKGGSPDFAYPATSGSAGPKSGRQLSSWPRSDASTRRRLRELCKSKPTLSAHYNRLLSTRSPSPFNSSSSDRHTSVPGDVVGTKPSTVADSFSRDMTVSLFSSTSAAVEAMHQITSDSATPKPQEPPSGSVTPRFKSHQKSRSLYNMSLGDARSRSDGVLASPFQPLAAPRHSHSQGCATLQTPVVCVDVVEPCAPVARPILRSVLGSGLDASESETATSEVALESTSFPDFDSSCTGFVNQRVRSRGFSLNDVSASSRRLSLLFEPPPELQTTSSGVLPSVSVPTADQSSLSYSLGSPPRLPSARRLGSPFSERITRPHFNTFPRNFSSHNLEPPMEMQEESLPVTSPFRF